MRVIHDTRCGPVAVDAARDDLRPVAGSPCRRHSHDEWTKSRGLVRTDQGNWVNPNTGEKLRPHSKPSKHGYHWDYNDGKGNCWRIYPDGRVQSKPC